MHSAYSGLLFPVITISGYNYLYYKAHEPKHVIIEYSIYFNHRADNSHGQ